MENRLKFAKKVANTISANHNMTEESFIFGLSGKWGEGKTHFLKELSQSLEKSGFTVIDTIKPWKYSDEKLSLLKHFIFEIDKKTGCWTKARRILNNETLKQLFFTDRKVKNLSVGWLLATIIYLALLLLLVFLFRKYDTLALFSSITLTGVYTILINPLLKIFTNDVLVTEETKKSITESIEFDDVLDKILAKLSNKRIVVLIDDLDRVSPNSARKFLDSIRTFFDKPQITYVVTGDHEVLEYNLGLELLPDAKNRISQMEEGRRFLKKIFNLYWRLPLPLDRDIEEFVDERLSKYNEGEETFLNEEQILVFRRWLADHFQRNLRAIERFIDYTFFSLGLAKENDLSTILTHPLILIRILMIQELANPYYRVFEKDLRLYWQLEYFSSLNNLTEVETTLNRIRNKGAFSDESSQDIFLKHFLQSEHRPFKGPALKVNLEPFFYLASDPSSPLYTGLTDEDFNTYLLDDSITPITDAFVLVDESRSNTLADLSIKSIQDDQNIDNKTKKLFTLTVAISSLPKEHSAIERILNSYKSMDWTFLDNIAIESKIAFYYALWSVLDRQYAVYTSDFEPIFRLNVDAQHMELLVAVSSPGLFTKKILAYWYMNALESNTGLAVTQLFEVLVKTEATEDVLGSKIRDKLIDLAINNRYRNETIENLIQLFGSRGAHELANRMHELGKREIVKGADNDTVWRWFIELSQKYNNHFRLDDIRDNYYNYFEGSEITDSSENFNGALNWLVGKHQLVPEEIWKRIIKQNTMRLVPILARIDKSARLTQLKPSNNQQEALFNAFSNYLPRVETSLIKGYLSALGPNVWLWQDPLNPDLTHIQNYINNPADESAGRIASWHQKMGIS